ncbi:MAG: ubiquinol-cytochrome c reductase iron-sulfur subunit [Planctomycetes bacterium]|nr:ubiquinol-cytochrome c reductase iron-sulfur subunit [Planctomycetota bacterium]
MDLSKMAWLTFTGASLLGGATCGRFMIRNVLFEPPSVFNAGKIETYEWDKPDERFQQTYGVWIVKLSQDVDELEGKPTLIALSVVCTHLGCTPNILLAEQKIKCPCHGSGFRLNGVNFEGPAPRPLERYKVSLDPATKEIVVDKTKKFQWENGEWVSPESYIDLSNA